VYHTTFKCHSKFGVGATNVYISFQVLTAIIDKFMFYCFVTAQVLDERSDVSNKASPKRRAVRLLRCAETQ
jgi:hypothetical protein